MSGVWALRRESNHKMEVEGDAKLQSSNDDNILAMAMVGQTHFLQLEGEEMTQMEV